VADHASDRPDNDRPGTNTANTATSGEQPSGTPDAPHDTDSDLDAGVDGESYRHWRRAAAALPPMTPEEIAAVGLILRRIDARTSARDSDSTR